MNLHQIKAQEYKNQSKIYHLHSLNHYSNNDLDGLNVKKWKILVSNKIITNDFSAFSNIDISGISELLFIYGCQSGQTISEIFPIIALNNLFYNTISVCNYAPTQSCVIFSYNDNIISLFATMYNGTSETSHKKSLAIYFR